MAIATIQPSFAAGELSPSLYGRIDLAKFHVGCATMRNFYVNYRGGASSRAGTKFVGFAPTVLPPRLIRFQFSLNQGIILEFGNTYIRFIINGAYVLNSAKSILDITQGAPGVVTSIAHGFLNGDNVYLSNIIGMPVLNNTVFFVANKTNDTFTLIDQFGVPVNTTSAGVYLPGGFASKIYTIASPYTSAELSELKFVQSADVMSFTHHNHPPYDLKRFSNTNWTMTPTSFAPIIAPPTNLAASATSVVTGTVIEIDVTNTGASYESIPRVVMSSATGSGAVLAATIAGGKVVGVVVVSAGSRYTGADTVVFSGGGGAGAAATAVIGDSSVPPTTYSYVVTAVDQATGRESVASASVSVSDSVNISTILGTIKLSWSLVSGTGVSYRIYKGPPIFNGDQPVGTLYGYIGTTLGSSFVDNNINPDFTVTPPLYNNPFAPGRVLNITMTTSGTGYTSAPTVSMVSSTGTGAVFAAIINDAGGCDGVLVLNAGHNYSPSDRTFFVYL